MGLLDQYEKLREYIAANTPRSTRPVASPLNVIDKGLLGGRIEQMPQRAEEIKQGLLRAPSDIASLFDGKTNPALEAAMAGKGQQANPQQWINAGMELSGMAPIGGLLGATVYHGSPHKFSKFDMSKIGTGEGAQAYGHGLYFAENPNVAMSYQDMLGKKAGAAHPSLTKLQNKQSLYVEKGGFDSVDDLRNAVAEGDIGLLSPKQAESFKKRQEQYLKTWDEVKQGNLYKVDIPDESIPRMLDADAPLSQQSGFLSSLGVKHPANLEGSPQRVSRNSENVSNGLISEPGISQGLGSRNINSAGKVMQPMGSTGQHNEVFNPVVGLDSVDVVNLLGSSKGAPNMALHDNPMLLDALSSSRNNGIPGSVEPTNFNVHIPIIRKLGQNATGTDFYNALSKELGSANAATDYLNSLGVKGIRYLDGSSRNTTQRYIAKHPMGGENVFNTQQELDAFIKRNPDFKAINPELTSNYVLFDDQLPRILEVNGQPTGLLSWADEAAQKAKKPKK